MMVAGMILASELLYVNASVLSRELASQVCEAQGYQMSVVVADRFGTLRTLLRYPLVGDHTVQSGFPALRPKSVPVILTRLALRPGFPQLSRNWSVRNRRFRHQEMKIFR